MSLFTQNEIREINDAYDDLEREISKRFDSERMAKVRKAFDFSNKAHDGMRRKAGDPYITHPLAVANIVARDLGLGATSVIAAILHDVVEDTEYEIPDIENMFGKEVAKLVDGLTKLSGDFEEIFTLRKIIMSLFDDIRIILIKFADRLHNLRTLDSLEENRRMKIAAETLNIYAPLAHRLGLYSVKNELEDLSFKYKQPSDYQNIFYQLHSQDQKRNELIQKFVQPIRQKLTEEDIECTITHRLKSIYSIWLKMKKQNLTSIDQVFDLFAVRIILKSKPGISEKKQCYEVLSFVTDIYQPKPGRLRDWITTPRANGYESLHVTVMGPEGKFLEVQIRTERMDRIAEYGFAAHYKYKEKETDKPTENELDRWIEKIKEHMDNNPDGNAYEFLEDFRLNLFSGEIVVFTPKGRMLKLPKKSTIIDAAYEIHTDLGNKCIGAKVNYKLVPPNFILNNGDQIEILTSENQTPQPEWLNFVATAKASNKIKNTLRQTKGETVEKGREIVEHAIKEQGSPLVANTLKKIVAHYNLSNKEQLYSQVGMGILELKDLDQILKKKSQNKFIKYWNITFNRKEKEDEEAEADYTNEIDKKKPFILKETPDRIEYTLARCCNPIPGDDVVGYISSGDQIIIHKKDCPVVEKMITNEGKKTITAEWTKFKKLSYLTRLKLNGFDRVGMASEVTNIISKQNNINMRSLKFDAHDGVFEADLHLYIHNTEDLQKLIGQLEKVKGINKVSRIENLND